jgi:GntR family negative regulator for fad regulon and positive regulator of fabA
MTTYQSPSDPDLSWHPIQKPAELAESRLIQTILNNTFPINSHLPGERELAELLGVTRPTLRETLQRLARDGWVEIHQGKPTRVRDYWKEGRLGVLNTLSNHPHQLPENFIPDLLYVRLAMAPMYTDLAITNAPDDLAQFLEGRHDLKDTAEAYAVFDWELHHQLTILGRNPVFILILNGFKDLYLNLAPYYFELPPARAHSSRYYDKLAQAAEDRDVNRAKALTEEIMRDSITFWRQTKFI